MKTLITMFKSLVYLIISLVLIYYMSKTTLDIFNNYPIGVIIPLSEMIFILGVYFICPVIMVIMYVDIHKSHNKSEEDEEVNNAAEKLARFIYELFGCNKD